MSNTFAEYLEDTDIEARKRDYSASVLAPLTRGNSDKPEIFLNGSEKTIFQLIGEEQAQSDWRNLEGTFQAQEDSREFLEEKGESLAQHILKDYSTLADEITKHAEARASAAKDEKSAWLKMHNLSSAITRRETRAQRLIEGEIQKEAWHPPQTLMNWLEKTTRFFPDFSNEGQRLATRWQNWQGEQNNCVAQMALGVSLGEMTVIRQTLANWLSTRNKLLDDTHILVNRAVSFIEPLRNRLQGVEKELDAWGEWLTRQASQQNTGSSEEQNNLVQQIEQARTKLGELRQHFGLERKHAIHLEKLQIEFLAEWTKVQPDICPTCGENHHDRGGIDHVVNIIKTEVEARLANYEQDGKIIATTLAEMEAKLASFGICPVSEQRQRELRELLAPFCADASLQTLLTDPIKRTALKNSIQSAQRLPPVQEPLSELDDAAKQLAERCLSLDAEAERLWPLPERWAKIVKALKNECDSIVAEHLPETLQKLWWEVALALTSARWNLAATPVFQAQGRSTQKLVIGIEERGDTPARYLFNLV